MVDVVIGTALLSVLAMCLPAEAAGHQNDMLRYMGETFIGPRFGKLVGWVFGLLLLSAVNTAITGMVVAALCDGPRRRTARHLPAAQPLWRPLGRRSSPRRSCRSSCSTSTTRSKGLAALYAIGVVGAIAINLGSCAFAKTIDLQRHERLIMKLTLRRAGRRLDDHRR